MSFAIALDSLNNVYLTGYFAGTADFDPGFNIANLTSAGSQDIFIAKYDPSGNYVYAKAMGGTGYSNNTGKAIITDASGNVYVTGYFFGTVDFDPGVNVANLASAGYNDIFLAKYDQSGNYVFAKNIGGPTEDEGSSIAVDGTGNVYVTGSFSGTADFDPGGGSPNSVITAPNYQDIFIAKYGPPVIVPVDLLSFTATPTNKRDAVKINWSTASQVENAYFEVERSNTGTNFKPIGRVPGCITCPQIRQYDFTDNQPFSGISYYRLKLVDISNRFAYSRIAAVKISAEPKIALTVFPNVTEGLFSLIAWSDEDNRPALIKISDASGTLIKTQSILLQKGDNTFNYNLSDQPAGVYYISIADKTTGKPTTARVIKK